MQDLSAREYLSLWRQTGVEPGLDQLLIPTQVYSPQQAFSIFFSQALVQTVKDDDPIWVQHLLRSNLASYLRQHEKKGMVSLLFDNHATANCWFHALNEVFKDILFKTSGTNQDTIKPLVNYIKNSLDEFRWGSANSANERSKVSSLLLGIYNLREKEGVYPYKLGAGEVKSMIPLLTDKEKTQFLIALLQFECSYDRFRFAIDTVKEYNLTLPQNDTVYNHVLYVMISKAKEFTQTDRQQALDIIFKDTKRRNETIRSMIMNKGEKDISTSEYFPSLDQFCSLLPKEELIPLIKCILLAPLPVKDLPMFLKSHWERHIIEQELKPSLLFKIKDILFSSRTTFALRNAPHQSTKDNQDITPSRPRKKM